MGKGNGAPEPRDVALLILANVLWGSTYVVSRGLLDAAPPLVVAFVRFAIAALWMFLTGAHRDRRASPPPTTAEPKSRWADYALLGFVGLVGFGLAKVLIYEGLARSRATDAALIINLEPVFTAALAFVILRQRLGAPQWAGLAVSFAGGVALVWPEQGSAQAAARALGNALMVGSVAVESLVSVLGARATRTYSGLQVTAYATYWGAAALLPLGWRQWRDSGSDLSWLTLPNGVALGYLALGATVLAYALWFRLLERVDAGRAATYLYVQPLLGLALGIALRGEWPTWGGVAGGALVLMGIWLASRKGEDGGAR
ncbi:MAG: DMT family transporter [Actinomycetota bacterium]